MIIAEEIHRYPRRLTASVEVLSALAVVLAMLYFGRNLLRLLWAAFGLDISLMTRIPFLRQIVLFVNAGVPLQPTSQLFTSMLEPLIGLALTLLAVLLARNSLPTIRTSPRGMLVEFSGGWLAIPWEGLQSIKVTEDADAKRFVLLAETGRQQLTGWHRFYAFVYRLSLRRAFLITSSISDFDRLIKALLSETDRVAKVLDNAKKAELQETASSPLFRFLLSPAAFFSARQAEPAVPFVAAAVGAVTGALTGVYPARISRLVRWVAIVLGILTVISYLSFWLEFLALMNPALLRQPIFDRLRLLQGQLVAPWWTLVAGQIVLLLLLGVIIVLYNLLPALEARREGLAVRHFSRWIVVPWERIATIKETHFSEQNIISLIELRGGLPFSKRFSSLLYEGSFAPGVLLSSSISNYDALVERIVTEAARRQPANANITAPPILQNDAASLPLLLSLRAGATIDSLVEDSQTVSPKEMDNSRLRRAAGHMALLALLPALLLFADRALRQGLPPDMALLLTMVALFALSFLEWPLICLGAQALDDATGGGEEGYRPFYLYPLIQLPRLLPLFGALVLLLIGVPYLPILFWLGAIFWSFLLAAGLWEALYDWRGTQLLLGGLAPVFFQLLVLLAYLLILR